jgi:hypothetical protein
VIPDEKRLTPERVRKAYKTTGLKPMRGTFIRFCNPPYAPEKTVPEACCGSSAVFIAESPDPGVNFSTAAEVLNEMVTLGRGLLPIALDVTAEYMDGFVVGFDLGDSTTLSGAPEGLDFQLGLQDGRESAQVVFKS